MIESEGFVEALRLMGHPLRLAILRVLASGEYPVGEIAARTAQNLSLISQQLALLRKAGLVQTRREAKQVFYTLDGDRFGAIARQVQSFADAGGCGQSGDAVAAKSVVTSDAARTGAAVFARIEPRA